MKREADFQTQFNRYLRETKMIGAFELKQTKTYLLPFSALKEHQEHGLLAAQINGFVWKLSDADPREKPFDCISTGTIPAYVVIKYPKLFAIIKIEAFIKERNESVLKSLPRERAKEIATKVILTNH